MKSSFKGLKNDDFDQNNQQHVIKQLTELQWSSACFEILA